MGCLSSKSVKPINPNLPNSVANHDPQNRPRKSVSEDSGISSSVDDVAKTGDKTSTPNQVSSTKGVAFHIPASSQSIIKSHPPKRFTSYLQASRNPTLEPVDSSSLKHEQIKKLVLKQVQAEKLREQERHSVVARQKRREARARKVQGRKRKMMEETEEGMWTDDDLSDIENDQNFNTNEDYDLSADEDFV